jgi:hypothetical protein
VLCDRRLIGECVAARRKVCTERQLETEKRQTGRFLSNNITNGSADGVKIFDSLRGQLKQGIHLCGVSRSARRCRNISAAEKSRKGAEKGRAEKEPKRDRQDVPLVTT